MEIIMEKLIAAAKDLNDVLQLNPPMGTTFETSVKGNAKVMVEKKFIKNLQTEIIQLVEYQSETGEFDLRKEDLPLLLPETVEMIFELSPKARERMGGSENQKQELEGEKGEKPSEAHHQTRVGAFVDIINSLEAEISIEALALAVNDNFVNSGGQNNLKQSRHLVDVFLPCAVAFGKVKKDGKKISRVI